MSDHIWHRGLWFTIKYVNESNFWEEKTLFGTQSTIEEPCVELLSAQAVRIKHRLCWSSEKAGKVFEERRTLVYRSGPDGVNVIDWNTELQALQPLKLDRTPFTTWGGYGGLSYRASRELHGVKFLLPSGEQVEALTGQAYPWIVLQGQVDGGKSEFVSIAMVDHPSNRRSPSPWYCKSANGFTFMNAAFLFHEPMSVNDQETLSFRYRVFYRDGLWNADEFNTLAAHYQKEI
jgi:hypothetical protein